MNEKVKHVLKSKQTRYHTCHWPKCPEQVPPAMWGCRKHWFMLPAYLRNKIWDAYQVGQEETMNPSEEYMSVMSEVQEYIKTIRTKG